MRFHSIAFLLFIYGNHACANIVEHYEKTKDGITLFATISAGSVRERKIQDAFLDRLVEKLKRPDKNIAIYLLADQFRMFWMREEWFASIAYDTLRAPDPRFIENYIYYRMGPAYRKYLKENAKPLSNKHEIDLPEPVDLSSAYDTKPALVGLKIMYDYGETDSLTGWERMYTLVQYAIEHIDEIKRNQRRIVLPYPIGYLDTAYRKTYVSLLTMDTGQINKIPLRHFGFDSKNIHSTSSLKKVIWIEMIVLILALLIVFIKRR